jgi:hypothetical protein
MTAIQVTISEIAMRTLLDDAARSLGSVRTCPAGLSRASGRLELLVHRASIDEPRPGRDVPRVIVMMSARSELLQLRLQDHSFTTGGPPTALIGLGIGRAAEESRGWPTPVNHFGRSIWSASLQEGFR